MKNKYYVPTFHFDKLKPCYCGSSRAFGDCCCASNDAESSPKNIHIINNYLSKTDCARFIRFAEKQKREWLTVVDSAKSTEKKRVFIRHPNRVTQNVDMGRRFSDASEWFNQACKQFLQGSAKNHAQWYEQPQLLRYGPGGKYDAHADADHYCQEAKQFYRFIDRDFSMLIYLNDDYEGGELYFPGLEYTYRPVAGDLLIFPSNHIFTHASLPIKTGKKYALVSWGAFQGSPRVSTPKSALRVA